MSEKQPLKSDIENNDDNDDNQAPDTPEPEPQPVVVKEKNDDNNKVADAPKPAVVEQKDQPQQEQQQQGQQPGSAEIEEKEKDFADYAQEAGVQCNKCYNWFPIGIFGWIGGWVLIICAIIDMFVTSITFTQFFVIAYLICGGVVILLIELPAIFLRKNKQKGLFRKLQLTLYEWLKLLSRMWGRAVFNLMLVILCYSEMDGDAFRSLPWIAGVYLIIIMILYVVFGKLAAKKYNALFLYISSTQIDVAVDVNVNVNIDIDVQQQEEQKEIEKVIDDTELLKKKFIQKFHSLDKDNDNFVNPRDIARLANEADLELSNSEVHALFTFLDEDCNGLIDEENWIKMWLGTPKLNWL